MELRLVVQQAVLALERINAEDGGCWTRQESPCTP